MIEHSNTKIGLGLAALGRPEYINIRTNDAVDKSKIAFRNNALSVLDEAYKLGVRYFDTAPSYGEGEAFLNEWDLLRGHPDVVLGTKWGYTYVANWELGYAGKHEIKEHSLEKLLEQWKISKSMLPKLKYYQIHSATFESGILENEEALNQLYVIKQQTGVQIGVTTSGVDQEAIIASALKIKINGLSLFDCFQVTYNVFEQSCSAILKEALKQEKTVIIKEALANGRVFKNKKHLQHKEVNEILETMVKKYNVGVDALALRFVIDSVEPTYVLSGASNKTELKQNLEALNFVLEKEDLTLLQSAAIESDLYWNERANMAWN